jgi:hypothetical protein
VFYILYLTFLRRQSLAKEVHDFTDVRRKLVMGKLKCEEIIGITEV